MATALEKAQLHADLTQDLTDVYTNPLPNAYPLSAYSYLVTPCSPTLAAAAGLPRATVPARASSFPSQKGQALGQFVGFMGCAGQQQMATLGYSPLPPNLVQADFDAIGRLNGGVEPPQVSAATCKNPYVDGQIPLPGEPLVAGQTCPPQGCGVNVRPQAGIGRLGGFDRGIDGRGLGRHRFRRARAPARAAAGSGAGAPRG